MSFGRAAVSRASGQIRAATDVGHSIAHTRLIELRNVPSTATPADLRRLMQYSKAQGVSDVAIIYKAFFPTGTALVTLTAPNFLRDNLRVLDRTMLSGSVLSAVPLETPPARNVRAGDGPMGGLSTTGVCVIVSGLPIKNAIASMETLVKHYKLADIENPIVYVPRTDGSYSRVARCLLHFSSTSEAYRFIRDRHGTYFNAPMYGTTYHLQTHVIY